MYLSPSFNPYYSKCDPVSVGIIQELARNRESQAPRPNPELEQGHSHVSSSALNNPWGNLKTSFIISYQSLKAGYPLITDFRHTALHLSNLL